MHLDFVAEGILHQLDEFETWISTRFFPMKYKDAEGKEQTTLVQGALRPRRAYSFIFPAECLDSVLNTLNPTPFVSRVDGKGTQMFHKLINLARRVLRLKPIPKERDTAKGKLPMPEHILRNIRIVGMGIREDMDFVNEKGVEQEAL